MKRKRPASTRTKGTQSPIQNDHEPKTSSSSLQTKSTNIKNLKLHHKHRRNENQPPIEITTILPEDVLSKIFFDGYFDTFFVVKLVSCQISKRINNLSNSKP